MLRNDDHVWFPQQSRMASLLESFDWSVTDIGSPDTWPPSLRANVNLILDSGIPMMLGWGEQICVIYNDGYIPILDQKHPAIFQPAAKLFGELWTLVGPLLMKVYRTGVAESREDMLLPLLRNGVIEECYFTFSYSPIRDLNGEVVGLLSTAIETTDAILMKRRERFLQCLAQPTGPSTPLQVIERVHQMLDDFDDILFHVTLMRTVDHEPRAKASDGVSLVPGDLVAFLSSEEVEAALADGDIVHLPLADCSGLVAGSEHIERCSGVAIVRASRPKMFETCVDLVLGLPSSLRWDDNLSTFIKRIAETIEYQCDTQQLRLLLIEEAEDRYRRLFREALDGILLMAAGGEILAANPATYRLFGYEEGELIAGGCGLVRDDQDPSWDDFFGRGHDSRPFQGQLTFLHRSGERIVCQVTSNTEPVSRLGEQERRTVIVRDVTEQLAVQAQLVEAQKANVIGKMVSGIAHDFNNLLTVTELQSGLLLDELHDRPDLLPDIELLQQMSQRATGLVRRLLEFARQTNVEQRSFEPALALQRLSPLMSRITGETSELIFDIEEGLPALLFSPNQFEQIVMNFVVNARDAIYASQRRGTITVSMKQGSDGALRLSVADDGIGIAEDALERIFEPFYTTKQEGSGIGLSTVLMIVEARGGVIEVQSELGIGSTFTVRFAPEHTLPSAKHMMSRAREPRRLDDLQILLVEDQVHLRDLLARGLTGLGAQVTMSSNGEEAMRIFKEGSFDVVLSDVMMPLRSGVELVQTLLALEPSLVIVLFSGYAHAGVDVYLSDRVRFIEKPFSVDAVAELILSALEHDR